MFLTDVTRGSFRRQELTNGQSDEIQEAGIRIF